MRSALLVGLAMTVGLGAPGLAMNTDSTDDVWVQTAVLNNPSPGLSAGTDFGSSMALDGNTLMIGAPGEGAVHVYRWTGDAWEHEGTLIGPTGFGRSLGLDGSTAAIGTEGSVVIFEREGSDWAETAELSLPGTSELGISVAVDGSRVVAGDPGETSAAYVYERGGSGWTQEATLTADGPRAFGSAVDLDGDTAVVGAPFGAAYIFKEAEGKWTEVAELRGPTGFGLSVGTENDTVVVGAPDSDSTFIFRQQGGTWARVAELTPPEDLIPRGQFGWSVDISEDAGTIAVGAALDDPSPQGTPTLPIQVPSPVGVGLPHPGALHVYKLSEDVWTHTAKLSGLAIGHREGLGHSVAVGQDGDVILSGAPGRVGGPTWVLEVLGVEHDYKDSVHVFHDLVNGGIEQGSVIG